MTGGFLVSWLSAGHFYNAVCMVYEDNCVLSKQTVEKDWLIIK